MLTKEDFIYKVKESNLSFGEYFLNVYIQENNRGTGYFNDYTEKAIIAYNNEYNNNIKNKIFNKYIFKSLDKLVENTINNNKFYYYDTTYEDFKHEGMVHIINKLPKYNIYKGKAFSYFYIVCRNFYIIRNNDNFEKIKSKSDDIGEIDNNALNYYYNKELTDDLSEFMDKFADYMKKNLYLFFIKENEKNIAESIIYMFYNRNKLYSYKKKNIFGLLRERAKSKEVNITPVLRIFKEKFYELFEVYKKEGKLEIINKNDFFTNPKK
jgi:adenylate kinase family enzyme